MMVQIGLRRGIPICKTVRDFAEASAVVRKAIGTKPSSLIHRGTGTVSDGGKIVARVSPNGRVWPPGEWVSGLVPLYDPLA